MSHTLTFETVEVDHLGYNLKRDVAHCDTCAFHVTRHRGTSNTFLQLVHDEWVASNVTDHEPELLARYGMDERFTKEIWLFRFDDTLPRSTWGGKPTRSDAWINRRSKTDLTDPASVYVTHYTALWLVLLKKTSTTWDIIATGPSRQMALAHFWLHVNENAQKDMEIGAPQLQVASVSYPIDYMTSVESMIARFKNTANIGTLKAALDEAELALTASQAVVEWKKELNERLRQALMVGIKEE